MDAVCYCYTQVMSDVMQKRIQVNVPLLHLSTLRVLAGVNHIHGLGLSYKCCGFRVHPGSYKRRHVQPA